MHIDEIGSYGLNYVKSKARQLVGQYGFTWSDVENLQQEMFLDLIRRLPKYKWRLSPRNAFITRIVNNKVASIIAQRMSPSREHVRNEISINISMRLGGRPTELGDTLLSSQTTAEASDRKADLEQVLASLPESLRLLWDLRVLGLSWTEISTQTGVPRPTLHDRWAKVCVHLRQAGLGNSSGDA